jgi:hypothetical protein
MASTKITELSASNTVAASDLLVIVTDPSGSPTTKKVTALNLANSLADHANTVVKKVAVPANSTSTGIINQVAWDANDIYICVANNTWKKIALTSF